MVAMLFKNKQKIIESKLASYRDQVSQCMAGFQNAFRQYIDSSDRAELEENLTTAHRAESQADDTRRAIEEMMYSQALFPESRGDVLGLLEAMDRVPNKAEQSMRTLLHQHVKVPSELGPRVLELVDVSCRCVDAMLDGTANLFSDFASAMVAVNNIDRLESEADQIESDLVEKIFSSSLDGVEKILLRDLVDDLADISDRAENVGDRIRITVAKRRV